jgi:uncharacterized protein
MTELTLPIIFFFVALMYSSVGLGGGSSYTALLAIFGAPHQVIPTTSLTMNLIVTFVGMIQFWKKGHGRLGLIIPFLLPSIPMTFLGGSIDVSEFYFKIFLLMTLILVAVRIYIINDLTISIRLSRPQRWVFIFSLGSVLGFIAGVVGIGGGIYLVPLIIMFGLGTEKEAAAAGTMFIWINSMVGLMSRVSLGGLDLQFVLPLAGAVFLGGLGGSYLGVVKFKPKTIQKVMGGVILIAIIFLLKGIL